MRTPALKDSFALSHACRTAAYIAVVTSDAGTHSLRLLSVGVSARSVLGCPGNLVEKLLRQGMRFAARAVARAGWAASSSGLEEERQQHILMAPLFVFVFVFVAGWETSTDSNAMTSLEEGLEVAEMLAASWTEKGDARMALNLQFAVVGGG